MYQMAQVMTSPVIRVLEVLLKSTTTARTDIVFSGMAMESLNGGFQQKMPDFSKSVSSLVSHNETILQESSLSRYSLSIILEELNLCADPTKLAAGRKMNLKDPALHRVATSAIVFMQPSKLTLTSNTMP